MRRHRWLVQSGRACCGGRRTPKHCCCAQRELGGAFPEILGPLLHERNWQLAHTVHNVREAWRSLPRACFGCGPTPAVANTRCVPVSVTRSLSLSLQAAQHGNKRVVLVIGRGHVPGVVYCLMQPYRARKSFRVPSADLTQLAGPAAPPPATAALP